MTENKNKRSPARPIQRAPSGAFAQNHVDEAESARFSRRLLIDTIRHLEPFKRSLTVIGAHAVYARVQAAIPEIMMQSTKDADLAVNPEFVAPEPAIRALMAAAGLEPAHPDRPGIYGYEHESGKRQTERTTIDLIVPEAYAGAGRRAARITGQKNAATKAEGIELALYDRSLMRIHPLPGDPDRTSAEIMVAGHAALLVAKAYKIRDRIRQYNERPRRLRAKDSADVGLLMLTSDPREVAETMRRICAEHAEIADMGAVAANMIVSEYLRDSSGLVRDDLLEGVQQARSDAADRIDAWLRGFDDASAVWRDRARATRDPEEKERALHDRYRRFPELRADGSNAQENGKHDSPELG